MSITKGTILVHDGTKLVGLDPGPDGDSLVFDNTTATGLKWIKPKGVAKVAPKNELSVDTTTYTEMATFAFPGSNHSTLTNIKIICKKDGSVTSCDIRIYDATNALVIAEQSFTNTNYTIQDMGTLNNLPQTEAQWEVQMKRTGGSGGSKSVYLLEANLFYE